MPLDHSYDLIDKAVWDKAQWTWTAFLVTADLDAQPGIGLMFQNYDAGVAIFESWRKRFGGSADKQELLRVAIITGTHPARGEGYTVTFTTDMAALPVATTANKHFAAGTRWRFHDTRGQNESLEWFRASVERYHNFFIVPMPSKPASDVEQYFPHMIGKTRVYFSDYVSISADSQDAVVLTE